MQAAFGGSFFGMILSGKPSGEVLIINRRSRQVRLQFIYAQVVNFLTSCLLIKCAREHLINAAHKYFYEGSNLYNAPIYATAALVSNFYNKLRVVYVILTI